MKYYLFNMQFIVAIKNPEAVELRLPSTNQFLEKLSFLKNQKHSLHSYF